MKARSHLRAVCSYAKNTFKDPRQDIVGLWPDGTAPITEQWIWPPGKQLLTNLRRFRRERIIRITAEQERVARCREQLERGAGAWTPRGLALEY